MVKTLTIKIISVRANLLYIMFVLKRERPNTTRRVNTRSYTRIRYLRSIDLRLIQL